jgi:hypothetical protein
MLSFHADSHSPSRYALHVKNPINPTSPANRTQLMKLDQLNIICTTNMNANSKLLCHAWNLT